MSVLFEEIKEWVEKADHDLHFHIKRLVLPAFFGLTKNSSVYMADITISTQLNFPFSRDHD